MTKKIHVCVAWPYAAGDRHIGHLAGAYLPPDIFARYHRLVGNEVLMVSGSDTHGTPITIGRSRRASVRLMWSSVTMAALSMVSCALA